MRKRTLTLAEASALTGLEEHELRSMAVQGEIPFIPRGESFLFFQDDLDLWCTNRLIRGQEQKVLPIEKDSFSLTALCPPQCVSIDLEGNSRAAIVRSLVALADESGFIYDPKDLEQSILQREEQGSTNIGMGIAIPHTLARDDGIFSDSFLALARLRKPAFFNSAPDGTATELLFLTCALTSQEHLNILARFTQLCIRTSFLEDARTAESPGKLLQALTNAEEKLDTLNEKKRGR